MSEVSNNFNHDSHLNYVIAPEAPSGSSNTPEDHKDTTVNTAPKKEKWSLKRKALTITGGIALAGALGTGIGFAAGSGNGRRAPEATASSAPASPTPEASSTSQATSTPETQNGNFKGEVVVQTETIEQMDAITDLNEFAKLPYADRFAYALAKNPQLSTSKPDNDFGYSNPSLIPPYFWGSIEGTAISDGNTLEGAKIVSALQYYGTDLDTGEMSTAYKAAADSVLQNGGKGVMLESNDVFVASGQWQTGVDRDGKPIDFINVTDKRVTNDNQVTRGEVTNQTIRQVVKLLNGDEYVTYPQGYGVDGQKSPIDGGTY